MSSDHFVAIIAIVLAICSIIVNHGNLKRMKRTSEFLDRMIKEKELKNKR